MKTIKIFTAIIAIFTTALTVIILLDAIKNGAPIIENIAIPVCISAFFITFAFLADKREKNVLLILLITYLGSGIMMTVLGIITIDTATLHIVVSVSLILATLFTSSNHEARS